jgi:hypothetical protein
MLLALFVNHIRRPTGAVTLSVIAQLKPITVIFTIPEDNIGQIEDRLRLNTSREPAPISGVVGCHAAGATVTSGPCPGIREGRDKSEPEKFYWLGSSGFSLGFVRRFKSKSASNKFP